MKENDLHKHFRFVFRSLSLCSVPTENQFKFDLAIHVCSVEVSFTEYFFLATVVR